MLERNTIIPLADALFSRCIVCGKMLDFYLLPLVEEGNRIKEAEHEAICCGNRYILIPHDVIVDIQQDS